jgi:predicted transcriptional regulator
LKEEKHLAVGVDEDGNAELLGEPTAAQKKTFQVVMAHRRMTSADLSKLMHVSVNAASTRLHVLHRLGLIGRKEMHPRSTGGREYVYYGVFCAPPK